MTRSTSCPCKARTPSGTRTCSRNRPFDIDARGAEAELQAVPITEAKQVSSVVEKFRAKYGAGDVKKYYSKLDVAVTIQMP